MASGFVVLLIAAMSPHLNTARAADAAAAPGTSGGGSSGNIVATQGPVPVAQLLQQIDVLHRSRDDRSSFALEQRLVDEVVARAPRDAEVLWRAARCSFWISDDPGLDTAHRSAAGKAGWELAERAMAARPHHVAGPYWAAVNIGSYALGLGIVKALSIGLEGKFRSRLEEAEQLDRGYERGAIDVAWGRFFQKLPWPKRDLRKAAEHYGNAIKAFPGNLRARVYLASLYLEDDKFSETKRLLDEVLAAPLGWDPPEDRRAKALATGLLADLTKKMK